MSIRRVPSRYRWLGRDARADVGPTAADAFCRNRGLACREGLGRLGPAAACGGLHACRTDVAVDAFVPSLVGPCACAWDARILACQLDSRGMAAKLQMAGDKRWGGSVVGHGLCCHEVVPAAHRRRPRVEATQYFFRSGMLSVPAPGGSYALAWAWDDGRAANAMLIRVFLLVGFLVAVVNGMLYKIIPFVCSLELQRQKAPLVKPSTLQLVSSKAMSGQWYAHLVALALLGAPLLPILAQAARVAFAASCALLGWNVVVAARRHRGLRGPMRATVAIGEW